MARWTASAKWAEGPALDGRRATLLGLGLNEGLGSKLVVVAVAADPEPVHTVWFGQSKRTMMKAYSGAVHLAKQFELQ